MTSKYLEDLAAQAQAQQLNQAYGNVAPVSQSQSFADEFNAATQGMDAVQKKIAFDRYSEALTKAAGDNVELLNSWQQQIAPAAPVIKSRGVTGALSDWYNQAALTIDKAQQPFYQLNSPTSENAINNQSQIEAGYAGLSDEARYREYQAQKRMADAKANDTSTVAAWFKNLASNPVSTSTDLISSALPAAAVVGANLAAAGVTGVTGGAAAPIQAAIGAATPAALAAIGAAQSVGGARGDLYEKVMNADDAMLLQSSPKYLELRQTLSEQDAKRQLGTNWTDNIPEFIGQAAVGSITGRLGGLGGIGKASIGREILSEGVGEYGQQVLSNATYKKIDQNQSLTEDALLAGVQGAVGGGLANAAFVNLPNYLNSKYGEPVIDPVTQAMTLTGTAQPAPQETLALPSPTVPLQLGYDAPINQYNSEGRNDTPIIGKDLRGDTAIEMGYKPSFGEKSVYDAQSRTGLRDGVVLDSLQQPAKQPQQTLEQQAITELGQPSQYATDKIQESAQGVVKNDWMAQDTKMRLDNLQGSLPKQASAFKIIEAYKSRPVVENEIAGVPSEPVYDYASAEKEITDRIDELTPNDNSANIIGVLRSLGGIDIKERTDLTGERGITASKKFPALFKNPKRSQAGGSIVEGRSLHSILNDGALNDYLPDNLKVSGGGDTDGAFNYISDVIRGGGSLKLEDNQENQYEIESLQYALDGLNEAKQNDSTYINFQARNAAQYNDNAMAALESTRAPYDTLQSLPQPLRKTTYQQKNVDDAVELLAGIKRLPLTKKQSAVDLDSIFEKWKKYDPATNADSSNRIVTVADRSRPKQSNLDTTDNRIGAGQPDVADSIVRDVQEPRAELESDKQTAEVQPTGAGNDVARIDTRAVDVKNNDAPKFSKGSNVDTKDLIIQHNISVGGLKHARKMGGLAVPSLAITKKTSPIDGFGEITLLGDVGLADPKGYARTKVYGADIYSPRYPEVLYKVDAMAAKKLKNIIGDGYYGNVASIYDLQGISEFRKYVKDNYDSDSVDKRNEVAAELLYRVRADEVVSKGQTSSGKRSYLPHTLENVVKILKKNLVGGEGFKYGVGSIRSKFTPQFKTVKAIRENRDRLVSKDDFKKLKEEVNAEYESVISDLESYYDGSRYDALDSTHDALSDMSRMSAESAIKSNGFSNVPESVIDKAVNFTRKLADLPTEYFEANILRDVDLSEFKVAIAPSTIDPEAIKILEQSGIKVELYDENNEGSRADAIGLAANKHELLFSKNKQQQKGTITGVQRALLNMFGNNKGMFKAVLPNVNVVQSVTPEMIEQAERGQLSVIAWHGTPHTVDKFSTDKIGTGVGAQAYGHGLYFADSRGVAENYRNDLARMTKEYKNQRIDIGSPEKQVAADAARTLKSAIDEYKTKDKIVANIERSKKIGIGEKPYHDKAISFVKSLSNDDVRFLIDYSAKGNLYQVELAPKEDEYLLWDKPLSEQSQKVKDFVFSDVKEHERFNQLQSELDEYGKKIDNSEPTSKVDDENYRRIVSSNEWKTLSRKYGRLNGDGFYRFLAESPKDASKKLLSNGIRGIKYLDGSGRANGGEVYNYVIFSDDDVEIKAQFSKNQYSDAQGFYDPKTGKITLIADNLPSAKEARAVFLHEVFHKRGNELLGDKYPQLLKRVNAWENAKAGTVEAEIYAKAKGRADQSGETGARYDEELIAYAIEEAVLAGVEINPSKVADGTAQGFMAYVYRVFTNAFKKLFPNFKGEFTADDLVSIAYGAANLELQNGTVNSDSITGQSEEIAASKIDQDAQIVAQYATESGAPTEAQIRAARQQIRDVEAKYAKELADGSWVNITPTGKPSKLTQGQWVQTRTDNFKQWFGDWENDAANSSKVVNEKTGEPLVVYHGSEDAGFVEFDTSGSGKTEGTGAWFTENNLGASTYSRTKDEARLISTNPNADYEEYSAGNYPAFLNIRTPFIADFEGKSWNMYGAEKEWYAEDSDGDVVEYFTNKEDADYFEQTSDEPVTIVELDNADLASSSDDLVRNARETGEYDGAILENIIDEGKYGEGYGWSDKSIVAFNPNQIKSATQNVGTFDSQSDDIRFSKRRVDDLMDFSKTGNVERVEDMRTVEAFKNIVDKDKRAALGDRILTAVADKLVPTLRWIQNMNVSDKVKQTFIGSMYRAENIKSALDNEAEANFIAPLRKNIHELSKKYKLRPEQVKAIVGYWASARYAPIANDWLITKDRQALADAQASGDKAEIDAAQTALNDRLSDINSLDLSQDNQGRKVAGGMSNAQAAAIKSNLEKLIPASEIEAAAKPIYDLMTYKKAVDLKSGKLTPEILSKFPNSPFYVPLTGDPRAADDDNSIFTGGSINTEKDKAIGGRSSIADDAIDASFESMAKTSSYAGWVDFKDNLNDVYENALNEKMNSGLSEREAKLEIEKEFGIARSRLMGTTRTNDNVIIHKVNGQDMQFTVPPKVIASLKSMNVETLNRFFASIGTGTRIFARAVTQFNPVFGGLNYLRDVQEKYQMLSVANIVDANGNKVNSQKVANDMAKTLPKVIGAAKGFAFGKFDGQVGGQLKEFIDLGGVYTMSEQLNKSDDDFVKKIVRERSPIEGGWGKVVKVVEGYNNFFEIQPSFAAYLALLENGVSKEDAAAQALELTNFRKSGTHMAPVKALYAFSQPIVTGGVNLAKLLKTRKGKMMFAANVVAMSALYSMIHGLFDDDEGGNKLDEMGDITRFIPLPVGDGKVLKIPVGFGLNQLSWNTAVNLMRTANGHQSAGEAVINIGANGVKTFAPVSPSEVPISEYPVIKAIMTITPTLAQPFAQVGLDRSAFGSKISPAFVNPNKLKAEQSKFGTADFWKDASIWAQRNIGVDVHPEQVKNIVDGYAVGILRDGITMAIENPNRASLGKTEKTPFFNQIYGSAGEYAIQSQFYSAADEAKKLSNELASRKSRGDIGDFATPEVMQKIKFGEDAEKADQPLRTEKSKLTKLLNAKKISPELYKQRVLEISKRREQIQKDFLYQWRKMQGLPTTRSFN